MGDCNGLSTSCSYQCPSQNSDIFCPNLQCENCDNSSKENEIMREIVGIDSNIISSRSYNLFFGICFFFTSLYIAYCSLTNIEFFKQSSFMDAIFSLLPFLFLFATNQMIVCFYFAANMRCK